MAAISGVRGAILPILRIAWNHSSSSRAQAESTLHLLEKGQGCGLGFKGQGVRVVSRKIGRRLFTHVKRLYERLTSVPRELTRVCVKKSD